MNYSEQPQQRMGAEYVQDSLIKLANNLEVNEVEALSTVEYEAQYRLILYLKTCFGRACKNTIVADKDSLELLLEANNFFFRKAGFNTDSRLEQVPFIARSVFGDLVVISSKAGKRIVYDLNSGIESPFSTYPQQISSTGYEIFELFPYDLDSGWKLLRFCLPTIRTDLFIALAITLATVVLALASPVLTYEVVGDVVPSGDLQLIIAAFLISLLLTGFDCALSYVHGFYLLRISLKIRIRIQLSIIDRILKSPIPFVKSYSTGELSSRLESVNTLASLLSSASLAPSVNFVAILGYMALMFYFDSSMAIAALCIVLVSASIQFFLARRQLFYQHQSQEADAALLSFGLDVIDAIPQIRSNACEPYVLNRWFADVLRTTGLQFRQAEFSAVSSAASTILSSAGIVFMYTVVIIRVLYDTSLSSVAEITSNFLVFFSAYNGFSSRCMQLVDLFNSLLGSAVVQAERVAPILQQKPEIGYNYGKVDHSLTGSISLRSVSFSYPDCSHPVFSKVSFDLHPGAFNVIFGPSGCGKSTIVRLLIGLYSPSEGSIFVDSYDLEDLCIRSYRRQFGVILQKANLPYGSIRDAVSSGQEASSEDIWRALEFANVAADVHKMPMGIETVITEGGLNISRGQRQRISIARAIFHKPRILIEDEATSSLDNESQQIISDNLRRACVTRIVASQRVSLVRGCDHMIVLNRGGVEAQGAFSHCVDNSNYLNSVLVKS